MVLPFCQVKLSNIFNALEGRNLRHRGSRPQVGAETRAVQGEYRDRPLRAPRGDIEVRIDYAREWRDRRPSHETCLKQLKREQGF